MPAVVCLYYDPALTLFFCPWLELGWVGFCVRVAGNNDSLTVSMPSSLSHLTALAVFYLRGRGVWGPLPGSVTTLTNLWCVARLLLLRHLRVSLLVYMSMAGWVGEKA